LQDKDLVLIISKYLHQSNTSCSSMINESNFIIKWFIY